MTEGEALSIIRDRITFAKREYSREAMDYIDALEQARKALEKQIEERPHLNSDSFDYDNGIYTKTHRKGWWACPNCDEPVIFDLWSHALANFSGGVLVCHYCPACGQALDLGEVMA